MKPVLTSLLAAAAFVSTQAAASVTYTNGDSGVRVASFGDSPRYAAASFGEVIHAWVPTTLEAFSFWIADGDAGGYSFGIAAWDGVQTSGGNLYAAQGTYAGGAQELRFSGIDTPLAAGSYIVYVTVAGQLHPIVNSDLELGSNAGAVGGGFYFEDLHGGLDPLVPGDWDGVEDSADLEYSATFSSSVAEPAPLALLLGGLGLAAALSRRRRAG